MALNDFNYIKAKVRRVTGRPSINQLTDAELIDYINSFLVYDFPLHTRDFYNRQTYSFQLTPSVAVYSIQAIKNTYSNFEPPLYVDGFLSQYFQNEQGFYSLYPRMKYSTNLSAGNGTVGPYAGSYSYTPVDPGTVVISTTNANGIVLVANDIKINSTTGGLMTGHLAITGISQAAQAVVTVPGVTVAIGDLVFIEGVQGMTPINGGPFTVMNVVGDDVTINVNSTSYNAYLLGGLFSIQAGTVTYATGAVAGLSFPAVVPIGNVIYMSANNYVKARPFAMLYFNNEFRFWPYPDRSYTVTIVAWKNPFATIAAGGPLFPELNQWGDVIAYGASLKILSDNLDLESYGKVKILFDESKRLAERRTMKQLSTQRVATIYDDGMGYPAGGFGYPF